MGVTIDELRCGLAPSKLASEAAARVGVAELSWSGAFDFASKRHPIPIAIIGLGIALWTLSAARDRARRSCLASLTSPLRELSSSLIDSATKVFRERAEAKRREFVGAAQAQVATGAAKLSDEIERRLENVIGRVPGGTEVRPLIEFHDLDCASVCARRPAVQTLTIAWRSVSDDNARVDTPHLSP